MNNTGYTFIVTTYVKFEIKVSLKKLMFRPFNKNIQTWSQKITRYSYLDMKIVTGQDFYHHISLLNKKIQWLFVCR